MKLSIRFAVPLFTLISLFIYWKGRKRIYTRVSFVDFTTVSSHESIL